MSIYFGDFDPLIHRLDSSGFVEEEKPLKQINQYLLVQKLGYGSYAKVYLAINVETKMLYALKRFKLCDLQHLDAGVSQLEREVNAMRRIKHPNIIHLYEVLHVEASDIIYLVIDYCDCGSLQHLLDSNAKIPDLNDIKFIFQSVLKAVSYLHSRGMVHQDIKPSNILLCSDARVFLADFGLGHSFQSATMVVGSPAYQAPEALNEGEFDQIDSLNPAKEDVWSLGVTLYQLLFNRLPFSGENVYEIAKNVMHNALEIPKGTDKEICDLLHGMLNVMPTDRMSVEDVMNSSFFKNVTEVKHFNFERILPKVDPERKINKIIAKICDQNYSFARPKLTTEQLLKNLSLLTPITPTV